MAISHKLPHHHFGVNKVFGTAETYKSNLQELQIPWEKSVETAENTRIAGNKTLW